MLNTKNFLNVYSCTGEPDDDGYITDPDRSSTNVAVYGQDYINLYKAINIENGQSYLDQLGKEIYGHPRQVIFGIKVNY